jgi:hypothetical protein
VSSVLDWSSAFLESWFLGAILDGVRFVSLSVSDLTVHVQSWAQEISANGAQHPTCSPAGSSDRSPVLCSSAARPAVVQYIFSLCARISGVFAVYFSFLIFWFICSLVFSTPNRVPSFALVFNRFV